MSRFGIYIEDKVEEFRISGKTPDYIGLTESAHKKLSDEFRPKERIKMGDSDDNALISEFLGLPVVQVSGTMVPDDGVYIHPRSKV